MYYWNNKENRKQQAQIHTKEMNNLYSTEIKNSIEHTIIYSDTVNNLQENQSVPKTIITKMDSVSAAKMYKNGKTAILNFASYKHPGGMFIEGSIAQEESLCHESFLYNVLQTFDDTFYSWNRQHLNRAMYTNRALYTPNILFNDTYFDVITCPAPNIGVAAKYQNVSAIENTQILKDRMKFIKDIAETQQINTLILGAFGCGVFKQNATEVANIWKEIFTTSNIKTIIHPIPDDKNLYQFVNVFH